MSKKFSEIASLLSGDSTQLFDRFVDVTLSTKKITGNTTNSDDLVFTTPKTGLKPDITVSATLQQNDTVTSISVTIKNINARIDFSTYTYAKVTVGYMKSGYSQTFYGQVYNIYMSKPNPNGELVFNMASAEVSDIYKKSRYTISFSDNDISFEDLLTKVSIASYTRLQLGEINIGWKTKTFNLNGATYHFDSKIEIIHWLNNYLLYIPNLPPIMAKFEADQSGGYHIKVLSTFGESGLGTPVLKSLSNITNAYICGTYGNVNCPFFPEIKPGELIYVDSKYFKTRVNVAEYNPGMYNNLSSIWSVINMQFTFSTTGANNMFMQLMNINNTRLKNGLNNMVVMR